MRFPKRPIYLDARFDEQGVYYNLTDEPERMLPWHRVRFRVVGGFLVFTPEDEHGKDIQHHHARIFFRVSLIDHPGAAKQAAEFQNAYIENSENQYTCKIDSKLYMSSASDILVQILVGNMIPVSLFLVIVGGYNTVPDNEPGIRFQNGIMITLIAIVISALFINILICKTLWRKRKVSRVVKVNQFGVSVKEAEYSWGELDRMDQGFTDYMVTTKSGDKLILPNTSCATSIARRKIVQRQQFGYKLFSICLLGGMLSGPLYSAWHGYMVPDSDQSPDFWGMSLGATAMVLFGFGLVYLSIWLEKRQKSKSQ